MIYCVEDDANIRELVVYTLRSTGFEACGLEDGKALKKALKEELPELILLDIMLPGEDGIELLGNLKADEKTRNIPVIMVTAKGTEYDKVKGLDLGADDYVAKPFGMMELISRIKAVLRRVGRQEHEVTVEGNIVQLTLKEYEMLRRLMENPNVVLTRDQLLEEIWGYDFDGETRTVDVHIRTLRQKLGAAGETIETVRGVGYRIKEEL